MAARQRDKRKAGFTVLEVTIVAALAALLVALLYTPMADGIVMVQRENTVLNMFRTGDILMSRLTSYLQPAILPIPTDARAAANNSPSNSPNLYKRVINSDRGFLKNGRAWRRILLEGTDFLPFCTPVKYHLTETMVDSEGLPILGITEPSGQELRSAVYFNDGSLSNAGIRHITLQSSFLGERNIHPALAGLHPSDYGFGAAPQTTTSLAAPRFADPLNFVYRGVTDERLMRGFAVIRFLPLREGGTPVTLSEAALNFDLNQDGTLDDTFARGSLVINHGWVTGYAPLQVKFPGVPDGMVLLQLNTQDPGYVPMFKLVGGFTGGNSPAGVSWTERDLPSGEATTLLVRLLLFDATTQQGTVMATGRRDGRQFITRQFQTTIELRNMTLE